MCWDKNIKCFYRGVSWKKYITFLLIKGKFSNKFGEIKNEGIELQRKEIS